MGDLKLAEWFIVNRNERFVDEFSKKDTFKGSIL